MQQRYTEDYPPPSNMANEFHIRLNPRASGLPFYTCGDTVRGSVVYTHDRNARGVKTTIKFTGVAKSKIGPRGNIHQPSYGVESNLFQFEKSVRKQGYGNNQTYTWPFEFTFPGGVQSTSEKHRYSTNENFPRDPGHVLPPSWHGGSRPEEGEHNSISYIIEATIASGISKSPTAKHVITIPFSPVRGMDDYHPILTPVENPLSRTTPLLDPNFRGHEHTIAGHSIALHQPTSHFDIRLELPEKTCAGSKIPMLIGVAHDHSRTTAQVVPPVYLKRILISLETCTRVRVPAGFMGLGQEPQECWSETTILGDGGLLHLPLCDSTDVHEFVKELAINEDLTPTFKTYNIARSYVLHIKVEVECAQKLFELDMVRKLCLLPSTCKPTTAARARRAAHQPPTLLSPVDEPPPPYEEVETSNGRRLPSFNTSTDRGALLASFIGGGGGVGGSVC